MEISRLLASPHIEITYLDTSDVDGEYIRALREELGLSWAALANILNVRRRQVEKWERGKRKCKGPAAVLIMMLREKPELVGYLRKAEAICSNQKTD